MICIVWRKSTWIIQIEEVIVRHPLRQLRGTQKQIVYKPFDCRCYGSSALDRSLYANLQDNSEGHKANYNLHCLTVVEAVVRHHPGRLRGAQQQVKYIPFDCS